MSYNDKTSAVCYYCVNNNNYLDFKVTFEEDISVNIARYITGRDNLRQECIHLFKDCIFNKNPIIAVIECLIVD